MTSSIRRPARRAYRTNETLTSLTVSGMNDEKFIGVGTDEARWTYQTSESPPAVTYVTFEGSCWAPTRGEIKFRAFIKGYLDKWKICGDETLPGACSSCITVGDLCYLSGLAGPSLEGVYAPRGQHATPVFTRIPFCIEAEHAAGSRVSTSLSFDSVLPCIDQTDRGLCSRCFFKAPVRNPSPL